MRGNPAAAATAKRKPYRDVKLSPTHVFALLGELIASAETTDCPQSHRLCLEEKRELYRVRGGKGRAISKEDGIAAIRGLASLLGRTPTQNDARAASGSCPHPSWFCKHFGSWTAGMRAAGLEVRRPGHSLEHSGTRRDPATLKRPSNYRPLKARGWTA